MVDVLDSLEEDEGDMVLLVEASKVVVEVDGWLVIIGSLEDDGLMGVDGLLIADCCLDVDKCRWASPSVEL